MGVIHSDQDNKRVIIKASVAEVLSWPHLEDNGDVLVFVNEQIKSVIARAAWEILHSKGTDDLKKKPYATQRVDIEDGDIAISFYYEKPVIPTKEIA